MKIVISTNTKSKNILMNSSLCQNALRCFVKISVLVLNIFVLVVKNYGINRFKSNPDLYKTCARKIIDLCIIGVKSVNNTEWICATCHSKLKCGKVPSCAKSNKITFPERPNALKNLTPFEERLILPRVPFMQIRELPSGGQLGIHGNIVNVPADVNSTVNVLPQPINVSHTIPIKLKHRLSYNTITNFKMLGHLKF